jgi:hypothetical protein
MPITAARRRMNFEAPRGSGHGLSWRCGTPKPEAGRLKPETGRQKPEAPLSEHRGGVEGGRPKV